jgi:arylsulfatase A-like enzyme
MPTRQRPNIVLVLADDMGYGDFSRFNQRASSTPALDQLSREGLTLSQHYSASPVCAPARAALLTGRYPHRTGAIDTLEARGLDRLALRETTIAEVLSAAGYRTGLVGKWHNGAIDDRYHPNRRGFDEFVGFRGGWQDYWDWNLERNGVRFRADGRYLTDVLTAEAIDFIRRHRQEPFFLHVAYNAPHFPFQAPMAEIAKFTIPQRSRAVATIYAMIQIMDRGVASLLEELAVLGIADNTLFMFSSDNGPQLDGEGENSTVRYNCGFAGAKQLVYEGGIRLPMILRWPAELPPSTESDSFVHFTDWFPTLASIGGARIPGGVRLDGTDISHYLRAPAGIEQVTRFWQWNRYTPLGHCNAAMRDGPWKLVRPALDGTLDISPSERALDEDIKRHPERYRRIVDDPMPEHQASKVHHSYLYDLDTDPKEQQDLSAAQPQRVAQMEAALAAWFEDVEADRRSIDD